VFKRALGCASTDLQLCNIAIAQIKFAPQNHAHSTNFYELKKISKIPEISRIVKLSSHEFSIYDVSVKQRMQDEYILKQ